MTDSSNNQFNRISHKLRKQNEFDRISHKLYEQDIGIETILLIAVIALLIIYYFIFSSLGNNVDGNASGNKRFFETILWLLFIILLLLNGISYIFGIDVIKAIKKLLGFETISLREYDEGNKLNIDLLLTNRPQVFQLSNKKYSYDNAKAACTAYDSRLATYDELSDAYNNGADWCNYGWSEGQMALFPTQKTTWSQLQTIPGHEKDCGHPGVNGGYIDNTSLTFGSNCFGVKPPMTVNDSKNMHKKSHIYSKNANEKKFDRQVDFWRSKISKIEVAPFNHDNWSMI